MTPLKFSLILYPAGVYLCIALGAILSALLLLTLIRFLVMRYYRNQILFYLLVTPDISAVVIARAVKLRTHNVLGLLRSLIIRDFVMMGSLPNFHSNGEELIIYRLTEKGSHIAQRMLPRHMRPTQQHDYSN